MKRRASFHEGRPDASLIAPSLRLGFSPIHSRETTKIDLSNVGASTDQIIPPVNSIIPPNIIRQGERKPSSSNGDVSLPRDAPTSTPPPSMSNGKGVQSVKDPSSSERKELVMQLDSLAEKFKVQKRWEDAIRVRGEAITHYRVLYDQDPDAHRAGLALTLHHLGCYLGMINRWEDAYQASEESVTLRRKLYELNPDVYRAYLAKSLHELGVCFGKLNRWEDACRTYQEAATLYRNLYKLNPDEHRTNMANLLRQLGDILKKLDRHGDALQVEEESIALYRAAHGLELDKDRAQTDRVPQVTSPIHEVLSQLGDIPHSSNESILRQPIPSITITPQDSSSDTISAASSISEDTVKKSSSVVNIIATPNVQVPADFPIPLPLVPPSQNSPTTTVPLLIRGQSVSSVMVTLEPSLPAGHGSYAAIYRGKSDQGTVALKRLNAHPEKSYKPLERFKRETELWKRQSHPNILPFLGIHEDPWGNLYMISPWQDHGSLNDFLRKHPEENRVKLSLHIAQGMQYLHGQKPAIVHGDLRGANILISQDRVARLADFGLSILIEDVFNEFPHLRPSDTTTGGDKGNVRWLAPEIATSLHPSERSRATDVYSYAMIMIEIFTGCRPFNSTRQDHHVVAALERGERPEQPDGDAYAYGFTERLWSLMCWCWQQNPDERSTADEIVLELKGIILKGTRIRSHPPRGHTMLVLAFEL